MMINYLSKLYKHYYYCLIDDNSPETLIKLLNFNSNKDFKFEVNSETAYSFI